MSILPVTGMPRMTSTRRSVFRKVFREADWDAVLPGGKIISAAACRDPGNGSQPWAVRAGLLMGKITSGGKYGASVIDMSSGALTSAGTTVTFATAAGVTELIRRQGATGTFTITGPPTAGGVVRTLTATYSATGSTTATIAALGVNAVHTLNFANTPAGTFNLRIVDLNGVETTTGPITYSGTAATLVSNINTALNTAFGASLIVASGSAVTAIAITFSGAGYAALPQSLVRVDDNGLTGGTVAVTNTTVGVDGRFVTGSLIGPTDGSQVPIAFLPDGYPRYMVDPADNVTSLDQPYPDLPIAGVIDPANFVNWPADTSTRLWIEQQMSSLVGGKYVFSDQF